MYPALSRLFQRRKGNYRLFSFISAFAISVKREPTGFPQCGHTGDVFPLLGLQENFLPQFGQVLYIGKVDIFPLLSVR